MSARESSWTETRWREEHVADLVRRLHRGDDAELCESRDVGGIKDLGVLDSPSRLSNRAILDGNTRKCLFVKIKHDPISAIANRVRLDLNTAFQRLREDRVQ